jgi:hypothetical protein
MPVHPIKFTEEDNELIRMAAMRCNKPFSTFSREAAIKAAKQVLEVPQLQLSSEELVERTYEISYGVMHLLGLYMKRSGYADIIGEAGTRVSDHLQKLRQPK